MHKTEAVWIETLPEVYIEDGIAHICERSGAKEYHMAMQPHMLLGTAQLALRVHKEWVEGGER